MKKKSPGWSYNELLVAFNLYCKIPFSKINYRKKEIVKLAKLINRTPSAVALKLANFSRFDPELKSRQISGMTHGSKEEEIIWNEFNENQERFVYGSEKILAHYKDQTLEKSFDLDIELLVKDGKEREAIVKMRVNQSFFRKMILASYNNMCCITGISISDLLVASHIIPWSIDIKNRMNPKNGICLNVLHDKAFDKGLITITPDYKIMISPQLKNNRNKFSELFFLKYEESKIILPQRFFPDIEFLKYHNKHIFQKN